MTSGLASISSVYGFNFNATNLVPPPMSTSSSAILTFTTACQIPSIITLLLILREIGRITRRNPSAPSRQGQVLVCKTDLAFHAITLPMNAMIFLHNRTPSMAFCQANGFLMHALCETQMTLIAGLAYERYWTIKEIQAHRPPGSRAAPHWPYVKFLCIPLIILHSALPWLTEGAYGAYGMKPNANYCYATSGRGNFMHDAHIAVLLFYVMVVCFTVIVVSGFKSYRIISEIAAAVNTNVHSSATQAAAKQERKALYFAFGLTLLFAATWGLISIHGILMMFLVSADWPNWFFDLIVLAVATGTSLNPAVHIYFDEKLQEIIKLPPILSCGKKSFKKKKRSSIGSIFPQDDQPAVGHNAGSVVSNYEGPCGLSLLSSSEAIRSIKLLGDARDRARLKEELCGVGACGKTPSEANNFDAAQSLIASARSQSFEAVSHSNSLVKLEKSAPAAGGEPPLLKASVFVRAPLEDVAAFLHLFSSNYFKSEAEKDSLTRDRQIVEINTGTRSFTSCTRYRMPGHFRDRMLCTKSTFGEIYENGLIRTMTYTVMTMTSNAQNEEEDDRYDPYEGECVRADCTMVYKLKFTPPAKIGMRGSTCSTSPAVTPTGITRPSSGNGHGLKVGTAVELLAKYDFKINDKEMEFDWLSRPLTVRSVSQLQRYFLNLVPLCDLLPIDAEAYANFLLDSMNAFHVPGTRRNKGELAKIAVESLIHKSSALKEINSRHRWFGSMVRKVLELNVRFPSTVTASLPELSEKDGAKMGNSMGTIVIGNITSEAAVDEWFRTYPAMTQFSMEQLWFRTFMNALLKKQLQNADFGLKLRVFLGAFLAYSDTISDIYMATEYFTEGRTLLAWATVFMVATCLIFQLLLVVTQNGRGPRRDFVREMMFTVLFLKPAVDAWKLANSVEQEAHNVIDPLSENMVTRGTEMFCKSIPSGIIQIWAVLSSTKKPGKVALASIAMSVTLTGYTSAMVSYDMDTSPSNRKSGKFYGFVPDAGRLFVVTLMMGLGAMQYASKALGYALLLRCGQGYAWKCFFADISLYIGVKVFRNDLWYFVKIDDGWQEVVCSFLMRFAMKVVTDFAGIIQFRHQYGLGGAYWTFNLLVVQASTLAAVHLYTAQTTSDSYGSGAAEEEGVEEGSVEDGGEGLEGVVWTVAWGLCACFFATFVVFLKSINEDFLGTFMDSRTGREFSQANFREADDPEVRLWVLQETTHHLKGIREEVKEYVLAHYETWETEKPMFWNEKLKQDIPSDMIPAKFLVTMKRRPRNGGGWKKAGARAQLFSMAMDLGSSSSEEEEEEKEEV
jgi:hypothetical protein